MVTYQDFAQDLRTLAAMLDHLAPDLPLPRYADLGLDVDIHVAEASDVQQAARALHTEPSCRNGYTKTAADIDTVHLRFTHVSDVAQEQYQARTSYGPNLDRAEKTVYAASYDRATGVPA